MLQFFYDKIQNSNESIRILEAFLHNSRLPAVGELVFKKPESNCFLVNVNPVQNHTGRILGRVISFSDITDYKSLLEELTAAKERNRIAREMHDSLGHTLTLLLTLLRVCSITYTKDSKETLQKIAEAINVTKDGIKELKQSISGLISEKYEASNLLYALEELFAKFISAGTIIDFKADGKYDIINQACFNALYRICQEAITNSVRHGKPEKISVLLRFDERLKILITDDGCGCKDIRPGFGLSNIEKRARDVNGFVRYGSDGEKGFNVYAELPYK